MSHSGLQSGCKMGFETTSCDLTDFKHPSMLMTLNLELIKSALIVFLWPLRANKL